MWYEARLGRSLPMKLDYGSRCDYSDPCNNKQVILMMPTANHPRPQDYRNGFGFCRRHYNQWASNNIPSRMWEIFEVPCTPPKGDSPGCELVKGHPGECVGPASASKQRVCSWSDHSFSALIGGTRVDMRRRVSPRRSSIPLAPSGS
jgi:hypothetical protein